MAQRQFLPISEVKWDLGKKEWQSSTPQQHHVHAQVRCEVQNKEIGKRPIRRRRRRRKGEDEAQLEKRHLEKDSRKKVKSADGGLDHLRILADPAQLLLESGWQINTIVPQLQNGLSNPKGQRPLENPLNAIREVDNLLDVTVFPMQGRIRLSQLRRQARLKKHQLVQETQGHQIHVHVDHKSCEGGTHQIHVDHKSCEGTHQIHVDHKSCEGTHQIHVDNKSCEDAQDVGKVAADQGKEVMGPQDVEALVAKCYSQMVEGIQEDQIHEELDQQRNTAEGVYKQIEHKRQEPGGSEPLQIVVGGHQPTNPTMTHPIVTYLPVQMINGPIPLLRTDELKGPSTKQHTSGSQPKQVHGVAKDQMSEMSEIEVQKDRRRIARHQRMLRTYKLRKRLREKLCRAAQQGYFISDSQRRYMHEAEEQWRWRMWNVQSWRLWEAEQQRLLIMSHEEREKYFMAQRARQQIEEQKASDNVHKPLNRHHISEKKHTTGGSQNLRAVPGMDQDELQLGVSHDSSEPTAIKCHEDQPVEQLIREPVKASEEAEKTTSCATGKTRLNQLKCEARLRNTDVPRTET